MRHNCTKEQADAVRAAIEPVKALLAEFEGKNAFDRKETEGLDELERFVKREGSGLFDPRLDPARMAAYSEAKLRLELLKPWIGRQRLAGWPKWSALVPAATTLMDAALAIAERRMEGKAAMVAEWNTLLSSDRVAAAQGAVAFAESVLSRRFPEIPCNNHWGYGVLTGEAAAMMFRAAKPEPVAQ